MQSGTLTLIIGATFFFILNLTSFIHVISSYTFFDRWEIPLVSAEDAFLFWDREASLWASIEDLTLFFTDIFCTIGMYAAIIHCCMQIHRLRPHKSMGYPSTEGERSHMLTPSHEESGDLCLHRETTEIMTG